MRSSSSTCAFLAFALSASLASARPALAQELTIPTPDLPSVYDPAKSLDVFSNSAIIQLHRALFRLDAAGVPKPDLVASFDLAPGGRRYSFKLADARFHDGRALRAAHAKESLERALLGRTSGFQKFSCIKGFGSFLAGKTKSLAGVTAPSSRELRIDLSCAQPNMIYLLADIRYGILADPARPAVGLGDFKLVRSSEEEVRLTRSAGKGDISSIRFVRASKAEALQKLSEPGPVAIYLYPLSREDQQSVGAKANVMEMNSWQNYLLVASDQRLPKLEERQAILRSIRRDDLVRRCYPGETRNDNLVPLGFRGYQDRFTYALPVATPAKAEPATGSTLGSERELRVAIFEGVGNETCVRGALEKDLSSTGRKAKVEVLSSSSAVKRWSAGEIDLIFFYLESEMNLDSLQFFTEGSDLRLAAIKTPRFRSLVQKLNGGAESLEQLNTAALVRDEVLKHAVALPFFNPVSRIILSKKLILPDTGMIAPTYTRFSDARISTQEQP
jgi:ABC-type transport system substrate-binding protein